MILLDGRRIVNQPMDGTSVDLNAIPLSVIDRVEVVRDGASAIYGTDAIGGVINFITKKTMTGLNIGGEFVSPQRSGGKEKSVNISYGYGDLGKDGFNIYGAYDYHKTEKIMATDRDFASTITSSTKRSVNSFPANYLNSKGDLVAANPACKPPYSIPDGSGACSELYSLFPSIQPEIEQQTAVLKGTTRLGDHELSLQYMITKTKTRPGWHLRLFPVMSHRPPRRGKSCQWPIPALRALGACGGSRGQQHGDDPAFAV